MHVPTKWHMPTPTSCYNIKHINNLQSNQHNKAVNTIANTLLAHPTTWCPALINAGKTKDRTPDNTISSWLLQCTPYLSRCKWSKRLIPYVLCVFGTAPTNKPPFTPRPSLKIQIFAFTYYNDRFFTEAITLKRDKHIILQPLQTQQGWKSLLPFMLTTCIKGIIHNATTKHPQELKSLTYKIHKLMESVSQIAMKHLIDIILIEKYIIYFFFLDPTTPTSII